MSKTLISIIIVSIFMTSYAMAEGKRKNHLPLPDMSVFNRNYRLTEKGLGEELGAYKALCQIFIDQIADDSTIFLEWWAKMFGSVDEALKRHQTCLILAMQNECVLEPHTDQKWNDDCILTLKDLQTSPSRLRP